MYLRPSLSCLKGQSNLTGVEIGVNCGTNAESMFINLDIKKLYLIDPYSFYSNQRGSGCNVTEEQNVECRKAAHDLLAPYSDRIEWIEKPSDVAVLELTELEFDFVYVDGNHMHQYVMADVFNYFQLIKPGGMIVCHDFESPEVNKGVMSVLAHFSMKNGNRYHVHVEETLGGPRPVYEAWWFNQVVV